LAVLAPGHAPPPHTHTHTRTGTRTRTRTRCARATFLRQPFMHPPPPHPHPPPHHTPFPFPSLARTSSAWGATSGARPVRGRGRRTGPPSSRLVGLGSHISVVAPLVLPACVPDAVLRTLRTHPCPASNPSSPSAVHFGLLRGAPAGGVLGACCACASGCFLETLGGLGTSTYVPDVCPVFWVPAVCTQQRWVRRGHVRCPVPCPARAVGVRVACTQAPPPPPPPTFPTTHTQHPGRMSSGRPSGATLVKTSSWMAPNTARSSASPVTRSSTAM
jgi:hypothetical protein